MAEVAQPEHQQRNAVADKTVSTSAARTSNRMSNALLQLQKTAGNRSAAAFAQTKLVVGHAADPAEYEADAIADEVLERLREPAGDGDGEGGDGDGRSNGRPRIRRSGGGGNDPLGGV